MNEWFDISTPLRNGMVHWPGDIDVSVAQVSRISQGDICNLTMLSMSAHTGTHMDAPLHFVDGALGIEAMPIAATVGVARVIAIEHREVIGRAELERHRPEAGERLLVKTLNSSRCWQTDAFIEDFVYIDEDGAKYLAACGIQTVGVDYLSVGGFAKDSVETHVALLGAGIWVIEGLQLASVEPGRYELVCLPLKLMGADGAPARAVLRRCV